MLGGPIDIEKTDGYVVPSINPSHQIIRGPKELLMVGFNSRMPSRQTHYAMRSAPLNSGYY